MFWQGKSIFFSQNAFIFSLSSLELLMMEYIIYRKTANCTLSTYFVFLRFSELRIPMAHTATTTYIIRPIDCIPVLQRRRRRRRVNLSYSLVLLLPSFLWKQVPLLFGKDYEASCWLLASMARGMGGPTPPPPSPKELKKKRRRADTIMARAALGLILKEGRIVFLVFVLNCFVQFTFMDTKLGARNKAWKRIKDFFLSYSKSAFG